MTADPESLQPFLDEVNLRLFGAVPRMRLEYVEIALLREQDVNANAMPVEMFNALITNLKREGHLETVPLIANRKGSDTLEIVSGHHRIRALRNSGASHALVFRYVDLTAGEIRAKQLAHNSIAGESDPQLVRQIFEAIDLPELKLEAFIDPDVLASTPKPPPFKPVDIDVLLSSKTVTLVFLETQAEDFARCLDLLHPAGNDDTVYLAHRDAFDGFRKSVNAVRKALEIKSQPTAIAMMAELAMLKLQEMNAVDAEQET